MSNNGLALVDDISWKSVHNMAANVSVKLHENDTAVSQIAAIDICGSYMHIDQLLQNWYWSGRPRWR